VKELETLCRIWYDFRMCTIQCYSFLIPFHTPKTQLSELLRECKVVNLAFYLRCLFTPEAGTRADVVCQAPLELISLPPPTTHHFVVDHVDFLDVILLCREALILKRWFPFGIAKRIWILTSARMVNLPGHNDVGTISRAEVPNSVQNLLNSLNLSDAYSK
jgi:hypothetical protein